jgi:hypothetical protein
MIEPFGNIEAFFGNHHFYNKLILENISSVSLNEIKNGNGNLLINYIVDGGLGVTTKNFKKIIDFTKTNNIPDEKVYLIFQDFNLSKNIKRLVLEKFKNFQSLSKKIFWVLTSDTLPTEKNAW